MKKSLYFTRIASCTCAIILSAATAHAATLVAQNFDSAEFKDYTNGETYAGFKATTDSAGQVQVIAGNGGKILQLTDSSNTAAYPYAYTNFTSAISTGATGENQLTGSFDFCLPTFQAGSSVIFGVGTTATTGGGTTAMQMSVVISGGKYRLDVTNGGSSQAVVALDAGVWYRISVTGDFSSTTQDKWTLSIATVAAPGTSIGSTGTINTRAANIAPTLFTVIAGNGSSFNSANPLVQVDNISFDSSSAIPEPAALGILAPSMLILTTRKK